MGANILEFNGVMLLVIGDVLIDGEAPVVTSSISRIAGLVFVDAHIGRVWAHVFKKRSPYAVGV